MPYRLVGHAEDRIDRVVMDSARQFGFDAAVRYNKLILAALTAVGVTPGLAGSKPVPGVQGLFTLPLLSNDIRNPAGGVTENPSTSATVMPRPVPVRVLP